LLLLCTTIGKISLFIWQCGFECLNHCWTRLPQPIIFKCFL